jgi:hypothetical protein
MARDLSFTDIVRNGQGRENAAFDLALAQPTPCKTRKPGKKHALTRLRVHWVEGHCEPVVMSFSNFRGSDRESRDVQRRIPGDKSILWVEPEVAELASGEVLEPVARLQICSEDMVRCDHECPVR